MAWFFASLVALPTSVAVAYFFWRSRRHRVITRTRREKGKIITKSARAGSAR
jgi:hypothetical protein